MIKQKIILALIAFVFAACTLNGDLDYEKKDSYTFTTTLTVTCSPNIAGYPQVTKSVTKYDNITETQARETAAKLTTKSETTSMGYRITSTMTCVYVLTKDYKLGTGSLEPKP
jgi:hypothetical protein